jgi:catechol 2,3-dioxygenase-like lactoylglutathione lyase family enzyme
MLELKRIVAFVITVQPEEAIRFYRDRLGLKFVKDDGFALVFDAYGTTLRIGKMKAAVYSRSIHVVRLGGRGSRGRGRATGAARSFLRKISAAASV